MNRAEHFVFKLCRQSFLSLWSYPNPQGKGGKELCDILVVCEPYVLIFSVKEIGLKKTGDIQVDWERWRKAAVEESTKQIYGAERWLGTAKSVVTKSGEVALNIPALSVRRVHRVAVALGSRGKVPISIGDMGKGYVHVFDEFAFEAVMTELDTITDFTQYLQRKEAFQETDLRTIVSGEENLLAFYLHHGRSFPSDGNMLIIQDDLWRAVTSKPEYLAKKDADKESYLWDGLIEELSNNFDKENELFKEAAPELEPVVRLMAREDRFCRRILSKTFKEFHQTGSVRGRIVQSPSGVLYVFLVCPHGEARRYRIAELRDRCFVARGLHADCKEVIGIATEYYEPSKGFSLDAYYLRKDQWTDLDQAHLCGLQKEFGYFVDPRQSRVSEDEYPRRD